MITRMGTYAFYHILNLAKFRQAENQMEKTRSSFYQFTSSQEVPAKELDDDSLFFQSSPIKALIEFGAENDEYLEDIVYSFSLIEKMDRYRGCLTGYLIGLYGESQITCDETDGALGDFFLKILSLCHRYITLACEINNISLDDLNKDEEIDPDEILNQEVFSSILILEPDAAKAWAGIYMLTMGLMSRLAQNRNLRDQLQKAGTLEQIYQIQEYCQGIGFVTSILNMTEHETVILLSPDLEYGVEAELEQIDSNDVFFTLFQFAAYHKGLLEKMGAENFDYHEVIERIALHKPVEKDEYPKQLYQEGCFGYYTYAALNEDGGYDPMKAVWGEGTLSEVPKLDGRYVILLTRPIIRRSWGNALVASCHPGLRPRVEIIRELSKEEAKDWLNKIKSA